MLEVVQLFKSFGRTRAVDGLSFQANAGEIVGLVGPNGAGKTTTLRCICGILKFDSGEIAIGGHNLSKHNSQAKRLMAFIPEVPSPYELLTVREHIQFIAMCYDTMDTFRQSIENLLTRFELKEKENALVATLSKGMKQKLAVACAILVLVTTRDPSSGPILHGFFVVMLLFSSLVGMMDLLKRLDLQKPLPLSPRKVVFAEKLNTIFVLAIFNLPITLAAVALFPHSWVLIIFTYFIVLSFLFPVAIGLLLMLLVFPDQSDITQRSVAFFLMIPVIALCALPGGIVLLLCFAAKIPLLLNAALTVLANAGVTTLLNALAAKKYEQFNPSE